MKKDFWYNITLSVKGYFPNVKTDGFFDQTSLRFCFRLYATSELEATKKAEEMYPAFLMLARSLGEIKKTQPVFVEEIHYSDCI